ncbi:hypothetical protein [Imhoffiella purpurea]|uniref:Long-chain-fatty-acid--CoA ligase n=1 Tax=Imhoffiella purpurea TaxID=1249627 RepID=W9VHW6_9GAMM|nr:hypothetical protein [Imhoffiella purpurea]EXJ15642.1 Long-chain-fatty-acid--CoA ligase [Imhoffiella purpurea]
MSESLKGTTLAGSSTRANDESPIDRIERPENAASDMDLEESARRFGDLLHARPLAADPGPFRPAPEPGSGGRTHPDSQTGHVDTSPKPTGLLGEDSFERQSNGQEHPHIPGGRDATDPERPHPSTHPHPDPGLIHRSELIGAWGRADRTQDSLERRSGGSEHPRVPGDRDAVAPERAHPGPYPHPEIEHRSEVAAAWDRAERARNTAPEHRQPDTPSPHDLPVSETKTADGERHLPDTRNGRDPERARDPGGDTPMPLQSSGDRILQALGQQSAASAPPATNPGTDTGEARLAQIEQLGERLAERILVSDRTQPGVPEVRIQLRDSVLQGGEIRLRHDRGEILVSLQVATPELAQQLSRQGEQLQQTLTSRLETLVRVEIQVAPGQPGNDASPGNGRSRNRQDPWARLEQDPE